MSHNDGSIKWYRSMTQEQRDEYNRRRYERLKLKRAEKARAAGRHAAGEEVTSVCQACGKEFTYTYHNHERIYCSDFCLRNYNARKRYAERRGSDYIPRKPDGYHLICVVCGKDFVSAAPRAQYCSSKCNKRAHYVTKKVREPKLPVKLTCVFCGKEFLTDTNHRYAKYCSPLCQKHARRYGTKAEMEATKAARKAEVEARRARDSFGCTQAQRNAVIKAQCGSRDELWQASQSWTPAQRKFAKARWEALHPSSFFTMSGRY